MLRWRSTANVDTRTIYAIGRAEPTTITRSERLLSLGQVAVGVVHDLKNVLVHPLSLNLHRIERALDGKTSERARSAIIAMRAALNDGLEAIERMQQFSRPNEPLKRTETDVEGVVWRATEIARAYAQSMVSPQQINIKHVRGQPKHVSANAFELLACIVNVLFNAIDAVAERGGSIEVRTGVADHRVWIEIVDDGPGMSEDIRGRIFEPFFTTKADGIGIGLAMVKSCVDRHEGSIRVISAPGAGTTFRVELPLP
jgi:signal transduction histidine kinase